MNIRMATATDSRALLQIYAQYIHTPITFEYVLPTQEEFTHRLQTIGAAYPYLVCEQEGAIIGYAYAHRHMERAAYQWNAELSVYLDKSFTSKGIGGQMYHILIEVLKLQGIKTVYGCVTLPNEKSVGLHQGLGFRQLGVYRSAGYKCGKWHDVAWFEKNIAPYEIEPKPARSIQQIPVEEIQKILRGFG